MAMKLDPETLASLEQLYPGILEVIREREDASLPSCPQCGSVDTASVGCGVVGRSIALAAATTRFKLVANGPKSGDYFCNSCGTFFNSA